nr:hypothetical protein BJQ95_00411 [Cryobacterium sp. SO1]
MAAMTALIVCAAPGARVIESSCTSPSQIGRSGANSLSALIHSTGGRSVGVQRVTCAPCRYTSATEAPDEQRGQLVERLPGNRELLGDALE